MDTTSVDFVPWFGDDDDVRTVDARGGVRDLMHDRLAQYLGPLWDWKIGTDVVLTLFRYKTDVFSDGEDTTF